jgi:ABC-type nitrate/sulfonate/bicarbonate transport system permease component
MAPNMNELHAINTAWQIAIPEILSSIYTDLRFQATNEWTEVLFKEKRAIS